MAEDIHAVMAEAYRLQAQMQQQRLERNRAYNRTHVQAKLIRPNYAALQTFCRANGLSINSALNYLITTHPEIHGRVQSSTAQSDQVVSGGEQV